MSQSENWWNEFFDTFRPVFGVVDAKTTRAEARYLIKKLKLGPRKSFLDLACGIDRLSIPVARSGTRVTGVDIMSSFLEELDRKAKRGKLRIETIQSDMRRINFRNHFDSAANMWTSFGYFEGESDNQLVLRKVYQSLKPGGRFLLHTINRDWVIKNFARTGWFSVGATKVLEERSFDFSTSISRSVWTFIRDGEEKSHRVAIRMYSLHELIAMLEKAGFREIEGFGSLKDEPVSSHSRMMYIFGRKQKN